MQTANTIRHDRDELYTLGWVASFLRKYPAPLCCGLLALLISSASLLALPNIFADFIDHSISSPIESRLPFPLLAAFAVVGIYAAASAVRLYLLSWVGERMVADIRSRVFGHLLKMPLSFFERHPTGDLLSRISSDVALLETMVGIVIPIGLRSLIQLLGALLLMALLHWQLTAGILLISPLLIQIARRYGRKVRQTAAHARESEALVMGQIETVLNAIPTVKSFTAEMTAHLQFLSVSERNFRSNVKLMRSRAEFSFAILFLSLNLCVVVLYLGGLQLLEHQPGRSHMVQFILYLSIAALSFAGLAEIFGEIKKAMSAAERLFQLLEHSLESSRQNPPSPIPQGLGMFELEKVTFSYPNRLGHPALKNICLKLRPGKMTALVGLSGAGKTTLLRLLLRLYDPQEGSIRLDGVDLRDMNPQELRQQLAWVEQEPVIFSGTVKENIQYGNIHATEAEIMTAAKLAQVDEFACRLPLGYDTPIGEKGQQLSSGQRQRLAIARALVRQPRILMLDEATSALDAENDALLRQSFSQIMPDRTLIVIAHRLATVRTADWVVVMNQGRISDQGTHAELLARCSLYAHLVALEFESLSC